MHRGVILACILASLLVSNGCGDKQNTEANSDQQAGLASDETAAGQAAEGKADAGSPGAGQEELWLDYQSGVAKAAAEDKFLIIDFWTSWCHWCKVMEKETYSDKAVRRRLAEAFVAVKVDAESSKAQGKDLSGLSGRDLAREYQVRSYPTTWFVDAKGEKIAPLPGYVEPKQFLVVLDYIASGAYQSQSFKDYQGARENG